MTDLAISLVFCLFMATGAWLDTTSRRLPNLLCLLVAAAGFAATFVASGVEGLVSAVPHAVLALAAGMVLFRLNMVGGGDAKFYAAVAAWFPLPHAVKLIAYISICGLILLVVWFGYRRLFGAREKSDRGKAFDGLPYGVAIAAGAVLCWLN